MLVLSHEIVCDFSGLSVTCIKKSGEKIHNLAILISGAVRHHFDICVF